MSGTATRTAAQRARFEVPLYTVVGAARHLGVPPATFSTWARGYTRRRHGRPPTTGGPVLTVVPSVTGPHGPTVPFVGLAEGMVLTAIREAGVPMQRIRPALDRLTLELDVEHALASRALFTDGAELLYDYAHSSSTPEARSTKELVVVRNGQRVFTDVVDRYLQRIEYGPDRYAVRLRLPRYERASVLVDPAHAFGQPFFEHGGAAVEDVLERFWSDPEESLDDLAEEFGVPVDELLDVIRVASRPAA